MKNVSNKYMDEIARFYKHATKTVVHAAYSNNSIKSFGWLFQRITKLAVSAEQNDYYSTCEGGYEKREPLQGNHES